MASLVFSSASMPIQKDDLLATLQSAPANASLVQAMQARLSSLVGRPSGFIEDLPQPVQRRIKYLRDLQEEYDVKEEEYRKEVDELDRKYEAIYAPIFCKRAEVVKGQLEAPPGGEAATPEHEGAEPIPVGIPEFWLGVLRANEVTAAQISEKDEEVLENLVDIRCDDLQGEEYGFRLTFEFMDNDFFDNKLLTKTYHMVDSDDPVLERAVGCKINWKAGKNVTIKTLRKKPKPGRGGKSSARPVTKTEVVDSFFSFFSPPAVPEDDGNIEEEELAALQSTLEEDYEVGETIRDELVPNAILWYTGEAQEEETEDEDEEEEDEEDDDDDDEEDGEPAGDQADGADTLDKKLPVDRKEQPPECKQQ